MPRGRPDPFSQVADGGRVHLVPDPQILEQDWPQLDEPQSRLAPGDDGVDAGAVAVVGADAAVAIAIECRGVTAGPAVALTGDEIDERRFLGLLHGLPLSGSGAQQTELGRWMVPGARAAPKWRVLAQYTGPIPYRQEGNRLWGACPAIRIGYCGDCSIAGVDPPVMK